jgi:hypothetical protein
MNNVVRSVRLAITTPLLSYFDLPNNRYRSGVLKMAVTGVTWTGGAAGESITVTIQPQNYNSGANLKATYQPLANAGTAAIAEFDHWCALNYGQPDPSANLEDDGTINLGFVEIDLPYNTLSTIVPTVTYTVTFEEHSPYTAIVGTAYNSTLAIADDNPQQWGMVNVTGAAGVNKVLCVQLNTLNSTVIDNMIPNDPPPQFALANVPSVNGMILNPINFQLSKSVSKSLTFTNAYTWVFAINNGMIDMNGQNVQTPGGFVWSTLSFGLFKDPNQTDDTANVTLNYTVALTNAP